MTRSPSILTVTICVTSLAISLLLLSLTFGEPFYVRNTPEKIRHLQGTREPYNTILVGTSVTYRHLNPEVVDKAFLDPKSSKQENYRPYTVNLGISDLRITELEYLAESILRRTDIPIRRVIMEMGISPYPQLKNDRALMTHTPSKLPYHLRAIFSWSMEMYSLPYSLISASEAAAESLEQTIHWLTRRGLLIDYLHSLRSPRATDPIYPEKISRRGFYPHDLASIAKTDPTAYDRHRQFLERHPNFLAEILTAYETVSRGNIELLTKAEAKTDLARQYALIAKLKSAGLHVVAFLPPRSNQAICHLVRNTAPAELTLVDLCDPTLYPELYESRFRVDDEHLEIKGVEYLNQYFAEAIRKQAFRARL